MMQEQNENKKIKIPKGKFKILELKSTITKTKKLLEVFNSQI
jgi:hypothetical protein